MERDFIAWLRQRIPSASHVRIGLGDDAAVLRWPHGECVVTTDMLMDGVDFRLAEVDARRVGHKALAVNLSDLAAMGALPVAAVVALALPRQGGRALAETLYEGLLPLAARYGMAIVGGDTNSWEGPLVISITAIGHVTPKGPLTRSGAKSGDRLLATGEFGGSILGKHLDFEPRVETIAYLHERFTLHAAIDVSDGLALDLSRMVAESRCGAVLQAGRIPIAAAAHQLASDQPESGSPLDHALGDGEDFELLLAVPPEEAARMLAHPPPRVRLTDIGEFTALPELWLELEPGRRVPLKPLGYEHSFG